jgi:hypothetical protein
MSLSIELSPGCAIAKHIVLGSTRGSSHACGSDGILAIANFPAEIFTTEIAEITESEKDFLSVLRVLRG